jgi:uncharacterized protein (DUF983 family)
VIAFLRRFFQAKPAPVLATNDERFARPRFKVGTKIICPQCYHHVATAKEDVFGGDTISSRPWGLPTGTEMRCPECGAMYCRPRAFVSVLGGPIPVAMQLHTDEGWR